MIIVQILVLLIIFGFTFFLLSIIFDHLIFSILSTVTWLIISASSILVKYPTGYSFAFSNNPYIAMFFYGIAIISILWTVILIKNITLSTVGGEV